MSSQPWVLDMRCISPPKSPCTMSLCPICIQPIRLSDDVLTLGCRGRNTVSTPHQMHCTPCAHEWLARCEATSLECPICRDPRRALNVMRPGGVYELHGCVVVLRWPSAQCKNTA